MKSFYIILISSILLLITLSLGLYFQGKPKSIINEYDGTDYTFQDIQFDMISDDFSPLQDIYDEYKEQGIDSLIQFENPEGKNMIIVKEEISNAYITPEELKNPFNIIKLQIQAILNPLKIELWESDSKIIIYSKTIDYEGITHSMDIFIGNNYYSISLYGDNLEMDVDEIIRTVNIKD